MVSSPSSTKILFTRNKKEGDTLSILTESAVFEFPKGEEKAIQMESSLKSNQEIWPS